MAVNDFEEIKKVDKKKMRLTFQRRNSLPRRSTIGSIDSVLSYDSASSGDPHTSIMQRIKALDCEFYDQEGMRYWSFELAAHINKLNTDFRNRQRGI